MSALLVTLLALRPLLTGVPQTSDSSDGRFRVHYTLSGADALIHGAVDRAPANGRPDDVDAVLDGLTRIAGPWRRRLALREPLADDGTGGDGRLDVYLRRLAGARGITQPGEVSRGPGRSVWIELDPRTASISTVRLAAAAAHEAVHGITAAYRSPLPPWLDEGLASYVEHGELVDAALAAETDALFALHLAAPEVPLDTVDGRREYANLVLVKYLVDAGGDEAVIPRLLDALAGSGDGRRALQAVTGRPIELLLADLGRWNRHACGADDGAHYAPRPPRCASAERVSPWGLGAIPVERGLELPPLGARHLAVPVSRCLPALLRLDGPALAVAVGDHPATPWTGSLVVEGDGPSVVLTVARGEGPSLPLRLFASPAPSPCSDGGSDGRGAVGKAGCALGGRTSPMMPLPLAMLLWGLLRRRDRRATP